MNNATMQHYHTFKNPKIEKKKKSFTKPEYQVWQVSSKTSQNKTTKQNFTKQIKFLKKCKSTKKKNQKC